ncbi:MAG TPA: protein kinase [Kofleriaceae bacterium]|nr:protein kinase [Kofleriaceae bacterium]
MEHDVAQKPTVVSELMDAQHGATVDESTNQIRAISAADQSTKEILESFAQTQNESERLIGQTLDGRYFILRKLGEGGMGFVYAARHAVIERPLAIKVLKRDAIRDPATTLRFVQEARAASRIGHPNIVDVTDFGTTPDGMTYSVMEFVDGPTLAGVIRADAPMPPERSIQIALQIARALGSAHDKGIVHRDLKPENVFLTARDGRPDFVKIVDFGIAKVLPISGADPNAPKLTRAGSVFGTPEYMAPEQAAGRGDIDGRVDIYALGTILYEMTCGRVPHKSNSLVRTIAMQMLDPITPLSQVRPELAVAPALERVVMKALAKNRDERYATMADFAADLNGVLAELRAPEPALSLPPVPPGADPLPSEPAKPRRSKGETRPLHEPQFVSTGPITVLPQPMLDDELDEQPSRRWPIAAAALVLLGAGAGTVWYVSQQRDDAATAHVLRDGAIERVPSSDALLVVQADDADLPVPPTVPLDGRVIALVPNDGGHSGFAPPHPDTITIEVMTRPGEAEVFAGHTYRGPSGVKLTEPFGTKLAIECRAPHFKGKIDLVFDGSETTRMCTAIRLPNCVQGLKNPYDDCDP